MLGVVFINPPVVVLRLGGINSGGFRPIGDKVLTKLLLPTCTSVRLFICGICVKAAGGMIGARGGGQRSGRGLFAIGTCSGRVPGNSGLKQLYHLF